MGTGAADVAAAINQANAQPAQSRTKTAERIPKRAVCLPDAMPGLLAADAELAGDFHAFYSELMAFAAQRRRDLAGT